MNNNLSSLESMISTLNRFLKTHTFEIEDPLGLNIGGVANVKIEIIGVKNYISVGDRIPHFEYAIHVLPSKDDYINKMFKLYFDDEKILDTSLYERFNNIIGKVGTLLYNFLKYFGIEDARTICKRIHDDTEKN